MDNTCRTVAADAVFRIFTACPTDPRTLILDVRDKKHFDRGHIAGAYCIRVPSNGATLLDYSKNEYEQKWGADCWWGKHVVVYGDAGLKKEHPVVAFLLKDKHARSVSLFRDGLEAFQKLYPFLVTTSLKSGAAARRYPSQLDPLLFLGDWSHAEAIDRHAEIGVKAIITIHNNPDNLKLPPGKYKHLKIELPDIDTADISAHLHTAFDFIEENRAAKRGVLVHCGAGVSRSATLCISWLMRKNRWNAQQALEFAKSRRSLVAPNDGFWRALCRLEGELGIVDRSNVDAFVGFHGADATPSQEVVPAVRVTFIPAGTTSAPAGSMAQTAAPPPAPAAAPADDRSRDQGRRSGRERSRSRERRRSRSRDRERDRRSRRSRSRSRDRDQRRRSSRSRSRSRDRKQRGRSSRSRSGGRDRRRDSRSHSRDRRGEERREPRPEGAAAAQQALQAAQQADHIEVESTAGAALEVVRDGKPLGHLVLEMQRPSQQATVGRLPSCEVPLEHLSISRAHAQLTTDGAGNLFITDLGSAHGTNVDGAWIKPKVPKQLRVSSVLKFGASTREYRVAKLPQPPAKR
ncbi:hypothetical protein ABPG77_001375 [Micractinium sp. CCAP 211/92]